MVQGSFFTSIIALNSGYMYTGKASLALLFIFHRKDLGETKHEMQSVFKFSDVLFALKSDGSPQ